MITSLTDEQVKKLPEYAKKWIDIGLSTSEIDIEQSLKYIKQAYENVGLVFPDKYEVCDSPFAAIDMLKEKYDYEANTSDFAYGAHDVSWLSFYEYMKNELNIKECEKLTPLIELSKHVGWYILFEEMVVLTRKPIAIHMNEDNVCHSEDELAIAFRDGTGVAMWRGTRIPNEWILDRSTITPDVMLHWEDVEQRRCACEIIGWSKVLEILDTKVIDKDPDPIVGTLLEVDIPDIGVERFLLALDPNTNTEVGLSVPNEMETALDANSWTYGMDKFEFKPSFRV